MGVNFTKNTSGKQETLIFTDQGKENLNKALREAYVAAIKEQVLHAVIPSLGPKNFEGEAIDYLRSNMLPITEKGLPEIKGIRPAIPGVKELSRTILTEFIKNVGGMITYDAEENVIMISPFILSLEFGDFYRPVLKTLTRAMEDLLKA